MWSALTTTYRHNVRNSLSTAKENLNLINLESPKHLEILVNSIVSTAREGVDKGYIKHKFFLSKATTHEAALAEAYQHKNELLRAMQPPCLSLQPQLMAVPGLSELTRAWITDQYDTGKCISTWSLV